MNEKDHFSEALATIAEQVKHIKESVREMKDMFNKMCEKLEINCERTKVLETRVDIIGRVLWGLGGVLGSGVIGLLVWIFKEGWKILHMKSFVG
jgi:hypothetical protein